MNPGILTSGYAPPQMPGSLLGSLAPMEMIDAYGYDADARRYIRAVEAADGQRLELAIRNALNEFVIGCKADGIWQAIKASCILMGARTLSGALVPLAGGVPTNINFVSGDYNRKTGLVGNGSNKYIDANRIQTADASNDNHYAAHLTFVGTGPVVNHNSFNTSMSGGATRNRNIDPDFLTTVTGFFGMTRFSPNTYQRRNRGSETTLLKSSNPGFNEAMCVFGAFAVVPSNHRISFYSMGSSLSLASLEARTTRLFSAIGAAIP